MIEIFALVILVVILVISILHDVFNRSDRHSKTLSKHLTNMMESKTQKRVWKLYVLKNIKNHSVYVWTGVAVMTIYLGSKLVFKTTWLSIILSTAGFLYPKIHNKRLEDIRKQTMEAQFRDALYSIITSLKSGLSMSSALVKCYEDLNRLHKFEKNKIILKEFERIKVDLEMGTAVDQTLIGFSERTKSIEITDFVNSIIIVREKGGNLVEVMENVTKMIADRINVKLAIKKVTAEKKQEAKLMSILPILITGALSVLSPDYLSSLYTTFIGKVLIVLASILLIINYFVVHRIIDIEI